MARVWIQQARYNAIVNRPSPAVRKLLERLTDLGQPYQCDSSGVPTPGGTFLGHDDHRLTYEDQIMFFVLRNATAAQMTALQTHITNALQADPSTDVRAMIRSDFASDLAAKRSADAAALP